MILIKQKEDTQCLVFVSIPMIITENGKKRNSLSQINKSFHMTSAF